MLILFNKYLESLPNSSLIAAFENLFKMPLGFEIASIHLKPTTILRVNEGCMATFILTASLLSAILDPIELENEFVITIRR